MMLDLLDINMGEKFNYDFIVYIKVNFRQIIGLNVRN